MEGRAQHRPRFHFHCASNHRRGYCAARRGQQILERSDKAPSHIPQVLGRRRRSHSHTWDLGSRRRPVDCARLHQLRLRLTHESMWTGRQLRANGFRSCSSHPATSQAAVCFSPTSWGVDKTTQLRCTNTRRHGINKLTKQSAFLIHVHSSSQV